MRVLCLLLLLSGALAAATVTTAELEVQLVDGVVTRLTNKLTGESCEGPRAELHGLWRKDGPSRFTFHAAAGSDYGTVATAIAADGEAVELRHSAEAGPGLRGVQWGLVVPDRFALLVPGQSGQRYDASAPIRAIDLDYPAHWECQFIIIETPRGGFLIQASDVAEHYKALHLRRVGEHWQIGFETQSLAPWEQRRQVPEAVWRLTAFRGPWTAGAALYREWASRAFGFVPLERQRPEWVDDIQFFHIGGLQPALLKALAARVEPGQTMLYVPDWRRDPYDRNYPDYTPATGVVEGIKAARAMGYRVMLHVNYFGCTEENPAYQQLRAYHVRDPYHDRPHYWLWERFTPAIKFAYINPAAEAWRALFVKAMVEAVRATGCDALHLDQTLCIYNDANGLVDGLNMMQGNLALHRELRAALPEVALSGEGLNEITTPHEAFAQRHLAGLQHADREWNPARIALAHPIASAVLRPQTAIYGYLGYTSPLDHDYFLAWQTGYERFGVLPTLKGVGPADFDDALVQQVLREAALYQRQRPRPRFADYGPETLFAWDLADGRRLEYRREPTGTVLAASDEVISRRISGVATAAVAGTVVEAVARSEQGFFGLDPSRSYPWRPEAPRPEDARVVEADPPQVLAGRLKAGELSVLELTDPSIEVALWHPRPGVRSLARLRDGREMAAPGLGLGEACGAAVHETPTGLFMHPPWREVGPSAPGTSGLHGPGHVVLEQWVDLPPAPACRFTSLVTPNPRTIGSGSDGVLARVTATAGEVQRLAEVAVKEPQGAELVLDLAPLAGRRALLRLETTPGPAGHVSFDGTYWERPRLEAAGTRPVKLRLASPQPWLAAMGVSGPVELRPAGDGHQEVTGSSPGRLYLLAQTPTRVEAGQRLEALPLAALLRDKLQRLGAPHGFARAAVASSTVGRVARAGLTTHPPEDGQIETVFALALPPQPLALRGFVGLRDGHQSQGVGFRVKVAERELWRWDSGPAAATWQPFSVDLSQYAGRSVILSLVADSLGSYAFDWASWGDVGFAPLP